MHTRQGVAEPAHPKNNVTVLAEMLREAVAPNWAPLEKLCPPGLCEQFRFMGSADGIYLYKHVDSLRYLNVDVFGRTYAFNPESSLYYTISVAAAMRGLARAELDDLFAPAERAALMIMFQSLGVKP